MLVAQLYSNLRWSDLPGKVDEPRGRKPIDGDADVDEFDGQHETVEFPAALGLVAHLHVIPWWSVVQVVIFLLNQHCINNIKTWRKKSSASPIDFPIVYLRP